MHTIFRLFIAVFSLFFLACSFSPNELKLAEKLLQTSPDSALQVLRRMQPLNTISDADRAKFGILYFEALDKTSQPLKPDSIINFSTNYFLSHNSGNLLATCYLYKARLYKSEQRFDEATLLYLKALDILQNKPENYIILGKIYADMGYICCIQQDYNQSLNKYQLSVDYFNKAGKPIEASYRILEIGRTYRFEKKFKEAHKFYLKALVHTNDSMLYGLVYQEMGVNYYWAKRYDSAQYYLRTSLKYPYKNSNFAIRCYTLADLYYDIAQYDSACEYASTALKHPSNFVTQRECYRILANTEYLKANFKQMAVYMTHFQSCSDSVRKVESQTKSTVLEDIHQTSQTASKTKQYLVLLAFVVPIILLFAFYGIYRLRKRNKKNVKKLEEAGVQISHKQSLLVESLLLKIENQRNNQAVEYKKSNLAQREHLTKELYKVCLHVNDWNLFKKLMNGIYNNIITAFEINYTDVTTKELTWICLFLLDIPTPEIALILDTQPASLYKLKQRLSQKMKLKGTKELGQFLQNFLENKNNES